MGKKSLILVGLFILNIASFSQNLDKYKHIGWRNFNSSNWQKFIDYESNEWKNIPISDKMSLLQIPQEELVKMTTPELIEASINSRYARRLGMYTKISSYYNKLEDAFNGFKELLNRENVVDEMIKYYTDIELRNNNIDSSGLSTGKRVRVLEYLLVHPKILTKYNAEIINILLSQLLMNYEKKLKLVDLYAPDDQKPTVYALAKLLSRRSSIDNQKIKNIKGVNAFFTSGIILSDDVKNQILIIGKSH